MKSLRAWTTVAIIASVIIGVLAIPALTTSLGAASKFADPAFQNQWQQGENVTANFYGPLATAHDGQQEPYKEAAGGQRLVQYFDKARMELGANSSVTSGLLATELITGKMQVGDSAFENRQPAGVPVAGDPNNAGPTYAQIGASGLTTAAAAAVGQPTTRALTNAGAASTFAAGGSDASATIAAFDDVTKHNVPKAFVDYRNKAGLLTIGLAIAEPFWANGVLVGGAPKDVLVQPFERRVLTYTPSNPDAFKVEFGNIGAHYFTWRYAGGAAPATGGTTAPTATPPPAAVVPGTLAISPSTVTLAAAPTTTFTLSGRVSPPPASLVATVTTPDKVGPAPLGMTLMTDASGAFTLAVPGSAIVNEVGAFRAGAYTLTVAPFDKPSAPLLIGTITVTGGTSQAATVTISPSTIALADANTTAFTISGKLMPNRTYDIAIKGPNNTSGGLVLFPNTDASGAFSVGAGSGLYGTITPVVAGTYTLEVHPASEATVVATATLTVTGSAAAAAGQLAIAPDSCSLGGSCDTDIAVSGKLQPNTQYVLNATAPGGTVAKATVKFTTDATGAFKAGDRADVVLSSDGNLTKGAYTLTVTTPDGTTPLLTGKFTIT